VELADIIAAGKAYDGVESSSSFQDSFRWLLSLAATFLVELEEAGSRARLELAETVLDEPKGRTLEADQLGASSEALRTEGRADWLPKKPETRERWRKAYEHMCDLDEEYGDRWDEFGDNPTPKLADYVDYLASEMSWRPSEKTVGRIRKAGREGWLE